MKNTVRSASILAAVVMLAGCNEWGLPGKNRELSDVTSKEWRYAVYEKSPEMSKPMIVAGHTWQVTGLTEAVPASMLAPASVVQGTQLFSLKTDAAPYDRLYTRRDDG